MNSYLMVIEMRQKQTFIVEYHQKVYHYSDGRKRITPIFIQTVDTDNYKRKRTKFSDQTMNKVLPEVIDITEPYEWTPHEFKPKVEVKDECKLMIKCETKDVKLFPKIECKTEFKNEIKYEAKPVPKSEGIKSEVSPSKTYSWDSFEFKSLPKRFKSGDDKIEEKTGSVCDSDFEILSDDEVIDEVMDVYNEEEVVEEVQDKQTEPKKSSEGSIRSHSRLSIASDISSTSDPLLTNCDSNAPKTSTPLTLKEAKKKSKEKSKNESKQMSNELSVSPEKKKRKKRTKKVKSIPIVNLSDEYSEEEPNNLLTSYFSTQTEVYDWPSGSQPISNSESLIPNLPTDILGVIFSKMSIKEKLRCECVCKEWQKIIVSQQKSLKIEFNNVSKAKWYEVLCVGDALRFNWETTFNNISEKLISKFTNLEEISIVCHKKAILNPIINHINEKLDKLTSVRFYGQISTDVLTRFGLLFGDKLRSLDINSGDFKLTEELINDSKLLKKLRTVYVNKSVECLRGCVLPQLREVLDINMKDMKALPLLADLYAKQITKIKFKEPNDKNPLYLKYGEISHTLNQLTRFQSLEYMDFYFADSVLDSEFQPIEQNCKNIKELHIFGRNAYFNLNRIHSFKELKVLGLFIECQMRYKLDFKSLLPLELTELWMYCDITPEQMIEILTQMKSLKTLHIISNFCWESGIVQILNCESNLETIYLEDQLLTNRSLGVADAFVAKAKRNPKVHYRMISEAYKRDNPFDECYRLKRNDLPKNVEFILHKETHDPFGRKRGRRPKNSQTNVKESTPKKKKPVPSVRQKATPVPSVPQVTTPVPSVSQVATPVPSVSQVATPVQSVSQVSTPEPSVPQVGTPLYLVLRGHHLTLIPSATERVTHIQRVPTFNSVFRDWVIDHNYHRRPESSANRKTQTVVPNNSTLRERLSILNIRPITQNTDQRGDSLK